ncbi:TPA: cobalt transporter CbiM [Enterococcus faecium]
MHLPDNYLSPQTCITISALAAPVLVTSFKHVKVELHENKDLVPMLGIASSLSFLMMLFNIPIPGGTTAHAVGGTLLAILIGPYAACLAVSVTLILQAFLFGDGGILSLGVNIFNMACIMPFCGYYIYDFFRKKNHDHIGVIVGSYMGINLSSLLVAVELGIQPLMFHSNDGIPLYNPYPLVITLPAMMLTHLLFAGWVEAFFSFIIYKYINKIAPYELYNNVKKENKNYHLRYFFLIVVGMIILSPIGILAQGTAFGEWSNKELLQNLKTENISAILPFGMKNGISYNTIFNDYSIPGLPISLGYFLCAVTGVLIFFLICKVMIAFYEKKQEKNKTDKFRK